jgi:hypothetical protein
MGIKSLSVAAIMGALALGATPSFAANINLGTLYAGDSASPDGGKVNAPNVIDFTVVGTQFLSLSATIAGNTLLGATNLVLIDLTGVNAGETWAAPFTKSGFWNAALGATGKGLEIQSGEYAFTIIPTGTANNSVGYSLSLNLASGVPELSSWAMMLAGFSALGFVGFRNKASATTRA